MFARLLLLLVVAIGLIRASELAAHHRFTAWLAERGAQATVRAAADDGLALAQARRALMRRLMTTDPRLAASLALPVHQMAQVPAALRNQVERRVSGRGRLLVACETPPACDHGDDDHDCAGHARLVRELVLDGVTYQAQVFDAWEGAVTGTYAIPEAVVLDDLAVVGAGQPVAEPTADLPTNELLARKVLYVIARFADETTDPKTATAAVSEMTVTSNFFRENTEDRMYFTALAGGTGGGTLMDVVTVQLPQNAATYKDAFSTLLSHARSAAGTQGFTYTNYNFDIVVTSNKAGFAYAGKAWVGSQGCHCRADYSSLRTMGHELGHNLGLSHAYYWRSDAVHPFGRDSRPGGYVGDTDLAESIEYGHFFSIMSAQSSGDMNDATKPHLSPMEKVKLNWYGIGALASSDTQTISSSGTYRVYRHDVKAQTGTPRGLRIEAPAGVYTGASTWKYWLSYRCAPWSSVATQLRAGLHIEATTGSYPIQLDATPFSNDDSSGGSWGDDNNDKRDGVVLLGRTYSDPAGTIHVTPVSRNVATAGEEYLDVFVQMGAVAGNRAPVISAVSQSATSVATGAAVNFGVTANDPDGDVLAYGWTFDPVQTHVESGLNTATASTSWGTAGTYRVRVTVSDMKGGIASRTMLVTVGSPANTGRIAGRVLWGGRPVAAARVAIGTTAQAWTDADGGYVLVGLAGASHSLSCRADGLTFTPQFTNPYTLASGAWTSGLDWHADQPWVDPANPATYTVSGTVTDAGTGMANVAVTVAGRTVTTATGGTWSMTGIPAGVWPVMAWAPGAVFSAVNATVTSTNVSNVSVTRTRYTISGQVTTNASGVPVTVRAGTSSVTGNSTKVGSVFRYAYNLNVPAGIHTVVASTTAGLAFTPAFTNPVDARTGNVTARDFTHATSATLYQIRGTVLVNAIGVAGVTVAGGSASAITGPDGGYVLGGLAAGSYTVTPSLAGIAFTPASASVTITSADQTQNFTAVDAAPTVATAASAAPATVASPTGSTTVSVLGADDGGAAALTYTWSLVSGPQPVTFSANGSLAAKTTTATFAAAGSYQFRCRIHDLRGQSVTSDVTVTVQAGSGNQVVTVRPYRSDVALGGTVAHAATVWDGAGLVVATSPVWTAAGGTITADGVFTPSIGGATHTITATAGGAAGEAFVTVSAGSLPVVTIGVTDAAASEPGGSQGNGSFTLTRSSSSGALTVNYAVSGTATSGTDFTALSGSLILADGQATATITVTPIDDAVAEATETVTVTLSLHPSYVVGTAAVATVTLADDDAVASPPLVVSASTVAVPEAGTATFTVSLQSAPAGSTVVTVARTAGDADVTVSGGATLTFSASTWSTAQTVTLAAANDADASAGSATITVSALSATSVLVTANEADDDEQALVVSSDVAFVPEGDSTTCTVRLAAEPAANVTVTVARSAGDADVSVSGGSSLTFTAATWSTPQTVTLAAADDDDVANGGATITVSASGLTSVDVTAAEVDDDTQSLVVDPLIVSVPEGDQSTFTVRLAYRPAGDTAVTVARTAGDSDLSVAVGASLLFSTTNWNVAQVVAVAAATDVDTDNGVATIEVAAADMAVVAVNVSEVEATGPTTPGGSGGGGGGGGGCGAGALALVLLALGLRRRQ